MFPVICKIGPFAIYSYGLSLVVAFTVSSFLARQQAKKGNFNLDFIFNLLFSVFIFGVIGARIFYIIENFPYYLNNPLEIIMLQHGGLSWFGGLILGVLTGTIYIKKKRLNILKTLDLVIPFVALGQAIGRVGCLLNGCCYGRESRFGIYFPVHNAFLIPTQLYSSLILILIFVILRLFQDKKHKDGQIFFTYIFLYSAGRFFIEFWRAEHEAIFLGFNLFQIISIILFILSFALLIIKRVSK